VRPARRKIEAGAKVDSVITHKGGKEMRRLGMVTAFICGILLALGVPAWSDEEGDLAEMAKSAKVTIDQAIKTASEKLQGTVVEAELEKKHDKVVWEVEIVGADGKVSEVHVDANSGSVIDVEEKKGKKKDGKKKK
jgi:uncharacterized membrane protein YkoI